MGSDCGPLTHLWRFNAHVSSGVLAGFALAIHWADEFTIGVSTSGRTYEEIDDAFGLFARHLPLTTHLHGRSHFTEVLNEAEQATQEIEKWQDYFAWPQDDGQPPFFPVGFDFTDLQCFRNLMDFQLLTDRNMFVWTVSRSGSLRSVTTSS